jgi:hypothetical protein
LEMKMKISDSLSKINEPLIETNIDNKYQQYWIWKYRDNGTW